jgi:hypothetical protein
VNARFDRFPSAALLFGVALLAAPSSAAASPGPLRASDVTVSAVPDSLLAGERFHYVVTVRHDAGRKVTVERVEAGPSTPFELAGRSDSSKRLPDGSEELNVSMEVAAFGSGPLRLPGFTLTEAGVGGGRELRIPFRPSTSVVVTSMTDSTMTQLRPVAPPVGPGFLPWLLLLPALALVGLLLFAVLHILKLTVLKNAHGVIIDPSRHARQKLKSLDRQLSRGLPPAEGYENLSNILREFLQHRYRFRAMEQVTQEIAEELESREVKAREVVLKLLLRADFIKFADGRPDIEECRSSLKIAEAFFTGTGEQLESISRPEGDAPVSTADESTR